MLAKEDFDSIFEDTKGKKKKAAKKAVKKTTTKKAAAKKAQPKKAPQQAKAVPKAALVSAKEKAPVQPPLEVDRFTALATVLTNHEAEALYRKGKEDKILILSMAALAALIFGVMMVFAVDNTIGWFGSLVLRLFFAGAAALVGLSGSSLAELNRKRLQDILAMVVKIHESFGFFKEGEYPTGNGPYFPNTYKFIGSINDDETNYAQLIIKIASAGAVVAIMLLA